MLLVVMSLKLVAEIALMAMLGQWLLGRLTGDKRQHNVFYKLLDAMTLPFVRLTRSLMPKLASDRRVRLMTGFLLMLLWLAATVAKISLCLQLGVNACR